MKKFLALTLFLAIAATPLFAHAGHMHTYMGTVTAVRADHSFTIETTEGKSVAVATSANTAWAHQDGSQGNAAELAAGCRVVVKMSMDGKTAASVRIAAAPKK